MKKVTKIVLGAAATSAAVLTAVTVSKRITRLLIDEALNRDTPKLLTDANDKFMDSYASKEPYKSAAHYIKELEAEPTKRVEITSDDGLNLIGHIYEAEAPKRIILAMHGWRSTWARDFGASAPFLHSNNCTVLYAEQRGQGESEGEYMGFGVTERYDVLNWCKFINKNYPGLPLYLMGISMGATTVLLASGLELPENVAGIIADCGFTSPESIFKHVANNALHLSYNIRGADVDKYFKDRLKAGVTEYSTTDALKQNTRPVLFIHGTDDGFVPISMTYDNYKACVSEKQLFIVPGADHGASYLIDKENYEQTVLNFFEKHDGI